MATRNAKTNIVSRRAYTCFTNLSAPETFKLGESEIIKLHRRHGDHLVVRVLQAYYGIFVGAGYIQAITFTKFLRMLDEVPEDDTLPLLLCSGFRLLALPGMAAEAFSAFADRFGSKYLFQYFNELTYTFDFVKQMRVGLKLCSVSKVLRHGVCLTVICLIQAATKPTRGERLRGFEFARKIAERNVAPFNNDLSKTFFNILDQEVVKLDNLTLEKTEDELKTEFDGLIEGISGSLTNDLDWTKWKRAQDLAKELNDPYPDSIDRLIKTVFSTELATETNKHFIHSLLLAKLQLITSGDFDSKLVPENVSDLAVTFVENFSHSHLFVSHIIPFFDRFSVDCKQRVLDALRELIEDSPVHDKFYDDSTISEIDRDEFVAYNYRKMARSLLRDRVHDGSEVTASEVLTDAFEAIVFMVGLSKNFGTDEFVTENCIRYVSNRFLLLYRFSYDRTIYWTLYLLLEHFKKYSSLPNPTFSLIKMFLHQELGNVQSASQYSTDLKLKGLQVFSAGHVMKAFVLNHGDVAGAYICHEAFLSEQLDLCIQWERGLTDFCIAGAATASFNTMCLLQKCRNNVLTAVESMRFAFAHFFLDSDAFCMDTDNTFPDAFPKELPSDLRDFLIYFQVIPTGDSSHTALLKADSYCLILSEVIAVQAMMDLHFQVARMANLPGYQKLVARTVKLIDKHLTALGTTDTNPIHGHVFSYSRGHLFGNPVSLITKDVIRFVGDLAAVVFSDNFTTANSLRGKLPLLDPLRKSLTRLDAYIQKLVKLNLDESDVVVEGLSTALMQLHYCIYLVFLIYRNACTRFGASFDQMRSKKDHQLVLTWFRALVSELMVSRDLIYYAGAEVAEYTLKLRTVVSASVDSSSEQATVCAANCVRNNIIAMRHLLFPMPLSALKVSFLLVEK